MTNLLLNDVPVSVAFCDGAVIDRWWGIALKYDLDTATMHFYDEQKKYVSDNDTVKIILPARGFEVIGLPSGE